MDKVIYTAIFGNYDTLKEPTIITPGWQYVCYTDQDFKSNVWEIRKRYSADNLLLARYYKILYFTNFEEKYSIWIDGSFTINCDLNEWWNKYFKSPITVISHPLRNCIYDEANICIEQGRDSKDKIIEQIEHYKSVGFPRNEGLIQSGILMRENVDLLNPFYDVWYNQVLLFSKRDQLSFSPVFQNVKVNRISDWKYNRDQEFIFTKHNKK